MCSEFIQRDNIIDGSKNKHVKEKDLSATPEYSENFDRSITTKSECSTTVIADMIRFNLLIENFI